MAGEIKPTIIKKYANRRLYNTGSSAYVTLEDLAVMVKGGEHFQVFDAKTNDDFTRSVLAQIIFEQEAKEGQSLLPIDFLRQLIGFYGDSMQMLVPSYLQFSLEKFVADQQKMREQFTSAIGVKNLPGGQVFSTMEEQARKNLIRFNEALGMFNPFLAAALPKTDAPKTDAPQAEAKTAEAASDLDAIKRQMAEMQAMLDKITKKG